MEQRHRAAVEVVPQLERRRRRRRLGVRVAPAAEAPGDDGGRVVGSVVPERAELLVRRRPRGGGRGREQAGQAAREGRGVAVGARRRRGRRGRARRRAARAGLVLRRRVDGGARRAGVHGYRRHGHGRRKPSTLSTNQHKRSEAYSNQRHQAGINQTRCSNSVPGGLKQLNPTSSERASESSNPLIPLELETEPQRAVRGQLDWTCRARIRRQLTALARFPRRIRGIKRMRGKGGAHKGDGCFLLFLLPRVFFVGRLRCVVCEVWISGA